MPRRRLTRRAARSTGSGAPSASSAAAKARAVSRLPAPDRPVEQVGVGRVGRPAGARSPARRVVGVLLGVRRAGEAWARGTCEGTRRARRAHHDRGHRRGGQVHARRRPPGVRSAASVSCCASPAAWSFRAHPRAREGPRAPDPPARRGAALRGRPRQFVAGASRRCSRGAPLLLDRFVDSSLAYQGAGRALGVERCARSTPSGPAASRPTSRCSSGWTPRRAGRASGSRPRARPPRARGRGFFARVAETYDALAARGAEAAGSSSTLPAAARPGARGRAGGRRHGARELET